MQPDTSISRGPKGFQKVWIWLVMGMGNHISFLKVYSKANHSKNWKISNASELTIFYIVTVTAFMYDIYHLQFDWIGSGKIAIEFKILSNLHTNYSRFWSRLNLRIVRKTGTLFFRADFLSLSDAIEWRALGSIAFLSFFQVSQTYLKSYYKY